MGPNLSAYTRLVIKNIIGKLISMVGLVQVMIMRINMHQLNLGVSTSNDVGGGYGWVTT